jgi:hypothetical protein
MPWSKDKVPAYLQREGKGKYTYGELIGEQFAPIPLEEAIKEVWADAGMSKDRIQHWLGIISRAAIMGATGARVTPDIERPAAPAKQPKAKPQSDFVPDESLEKKKVSFNARQPNGGALKVTMDSDKAQDLLEKRLSSLQKLRESLPA